MKRTERGFADYVEFKDVYNKNVVVRRSSMMGKRCVWIFPEIDWTNDETGKQIPVAGAHLDVKMARRVIKALQSFVDGKE